jgi:FMN-dependent NADH-azoreductase
VGSGDPYQSRPQTASQRELLRLSDTFIAELEKADEWIFGVPMHNFTVAASFRLWLDQVIRAGKTFSYASGSPAGLLKNKKAHFFTASGGVYSVGSPAAAMDFVEPYLRAVFGFIGIPDVTFHTAGGAAAVATGKVDRHVFLEPHLQVIRSEFQTA